MTAATAAAHVPEIDVDYATTLLAELGLTIAGRSFTVVSRPTFRQAAYIEKWRRAAKIDEMMRHFDPAKDQEVSAFVGDLIVQSFESDAIFHVLAGGLVEVKRGAPVKWTREAADALAEWIAELNDPDEQEAVQKAILGVLASFFLSRLVSLAASPNSSEETPASDAPVGEPSSPFREPTAEPPAPPAAPVETRVEAEPRRTEPPDPPDLTDRILASAPLETSDHSTS